MSTYEALKYTFTGANLTSIPTSAITSGTFANARISSGSVTQHVSAVTQANGTWSLSPVVGGITVQSSQYVRIGKLVILTAWGRGNGETYPNNFNTNRFYFTGAPITSMNTGTSSDCVGFGQFLHRGGHDINLVILSNSTEIRVIRSDAGMYAADDNRTSSSTSNDMSSADYNVNYANVNSPFHPSDAKAHWAFHMNYYVD